MAGTHVALVIRQQSWFRAFVDVEKLAPFPIDHIDLVSLQPIGAFRARVLIGRGPVDRELTHEFIPWFEHGEEAYPVFQCPSIGTRGGGLKLSAKPRRITITDAEGVCLIEISLVLPVPSDFQEMYSRQSDPQSPNDASMLVRNALLEARAWLEQAVGLYALYQYPVVWEPLEVHPVVAFVDLGANKSTLVTQIEPDNFIPFKLDPAVRVQDGHLIDGGLADFQRLAGQDLHLPLVLLQRALWQRNVQLRFLETFWLLDYLTSQHSGVDAGRATREDLYAALEAFIVGEHPQHKDRIAALKHVILQAPLRDRISAYLAHLGIECNEADLRRKLRVRNDLAHARKVDPALLAIEELTIRDMVRKVLRKELELRGFTFGGAA